jgi:putative SOS response-associated peptidase YedK
VSGSQLNKIFTVVYFLSAMCGRCTLDTNESNLAQQFEVEVNESITSRYNIAPSQPILTIKKDEANRRSLTKMKWGLVPNWVKDLDGMKSNLINARAETVMEKPSFREAFKYRPCLIPVSGFYEWTKDKQPYYYQVQEHQLFALAGLWELWSHGEDELITCTIITTKANTEAAKVHHRMPVIIQPQNYDSWLGELDDRKQLLDALPEVNLELYPVSKSVNSPKNDTPECIKSIDLTK